MVINIRCLKFWFYKNARIGMQEFVFTPECKIMISDSCNVVVYLPTYLSPQMVLDQLDQFVDLFPRNKKQKKANWIQINCNVWQ